MMPGEAADRLRLARTDGVGPITCHRLLSRYGSAEAAIAALPELARAGGRASSRRVPGRDSATREIERLARLGAHLLYLGSAEYPALLALMDDAPGVVALLGDPAALTPPAVALVGGRTASANGQRFAEMLAGELAAAGLVVVFSGLSRGVDTASHRGALVAGRTIAAVAGGIDQPYPPENAGLQARIAEAGGAVLAEAPLGSAPLARHFPPAQPRHRGPFARRGGGRGGVALGQPDHRTAGPGERARTLRRSGLAARPALPRFQRPAPPRCHPG
jgi:DNA processing protein